MGNERQQLPSRTHHGEVSAVGVLGFIFRTRLWLQFFVLISFFGLLFVLFHHYLPTYRDLWYDLRPTEKELVFDSVDQMHFVDQKNGQFLIWYETYPDRYRFFNEPGFYGAGRERELADTEEKITGLKQWVEQHAANVKQAQADLSLVNDLRGKLATLEKTNTALQDKVTSQNADIETLVKRNKELTQEMGSQKATVVPVSVSPNTAPAAPVVESAEFYKHGAIIPSNPKPAAWFQSLTWGMLPPAPYRYNLGNGFFEIPGNPESRIAPHPHYVVRNNKSGAYERPYTLFVKVHGAPPADLQIPRLEDKYYEAEKRNLDAVFNFQFPYQVTLGGVSY